ncbi:hypothetical protein SDC9_208526 [bioreactor metagenome]|uniref:Uncharacterized protein n=1 Tax=bioreactor metagenome TaxID=1076179 RepID=A0A645JKD6_9ZZZZ
MAAPYDTMAGSNHFDRSLCQFPQSLGNQFSEWHEDIRIVFGRFIQNVMKIIFIIKALGCTNVLTKSVIRE